MGNEILIEFLQDHGQYRPGDRITAHNDAANYLVRRGKAKICTPPDQSKQAEEVLTSQERTTQAADVSKPQDQVSQAEEVRASPEKTTQDEEVFTASVEEIEHVGSE